MSAGVNQEAHMRKRWLVGVLAVGMLGSGMTMAQEATDVRPEKRDGDTPNKVENEKPKRKARLIFPFSLMTTLTAEQEDQLRQIHGEYLEKQKQLREQEDVELRAVLTAEQVTELDKVVADRKAEQEKKAAERKAKAQAEKEKAQSDKKADQPAEGTVGAE